MDIRKDIPKLVDAFDDMSPSTQSYLMYQFLRKCKIPTLRMVANVVNPALKCDPFIVLTFELCLMIIIYLDDRSMRRAAQVSTRWHEYIYSDENARGPPKPMPRCLSPLYVDSPESMSL